MELPMPANLGGRSSTYQPRKGEKKGIFFKGMAPSVIKVSTLSFGFPGYGMTTVRNVMRLFSTSNHTSAHP